MERVDGNGVSKILKLLTQNVNAHCDEEAFFSRRLRSKSRYNTTLTVVLVGANS